MKDYMLEQMMSWFPTLEFKNSRLIPKVLLVCCSGSFTDFDETEEDSKENDDDINYDQVPSLVNSK